MSGLSDVFGSTTNWLIVSSVVGVCLLFMLLVRQVKHAECLMRFSIFFKVRIAIMISYQQRADFRN
jgi:hypothetical protein